MKALFTYLGSYWYNKLVTSQLYKNISLVTTMQDNLETVCFSSIIDEIFNILVKNYCFFKWRNTDCIEAHDEFKVMEF
jgi:hypothetical protein